LPWGTTVVTVITVVAQEHVASRIAVNVERVACRGEYEVRYVWKVMVVATVMATATST
jgi:hypothetical protein